ncbi:hypothetical protein IT568_10535 [bacterium]|nr:hypothetical protein [bacterium]
MIKKFTFTLPNGEKLRVTQKESREWWGFFLHRLRITQKRNWLGISKVDRKLSNYDVYVAVPNRKGKIPVLFSLQGISAPIEFSFYQIKPVLDLGIAWVGVDTPFGGSRSITNKKTHAFPTILAKLKSLGVHNFSPSYCFPIINEDLNNLLSLVLPKFFEVDNQKVALVGVSFGTMLASWSFINNRFGQRMIGLIGHGNAHFLGKHNPLHFAHEVKFPRKYHLMLGENDPLIAPEMAYQLINKMPNGSIEIAKNVTHGGGMFETASLNSIRNQLFDWK